MKKTKKTTRIVHKPISPKFYPLYDKMQSFTYITLYGGRASGKSWEMAAYVVLMSFKYRTRIACLRAQKCKISESSFKLIKDTITRLGLDSKFYTTQSIIRCVKTGSEIFFTGLNNPESFKSTEGLTHVWIEEAQQIVDEQWDVIIPTVLRNKGSQVLCTFNPRHPNDCVSQKFIENEPPSNSYVVEINYDENPHLSEAIIDDIDALREKDYDRYLYVYRGRYQVRNDQCLFTLDQIKEAVNRPIDKPNGEWKVRAGLDLSREGSDFCCLTIVHGFKMIAKYKWQESDTQKTIEKVVMYVQKHNIYWLNVDTVGLGGPIYDTLLSMKVVPQIREFKNNSNELINTGFNREHKVRVADMKTDAMMRLNHFWDKISILNDSDIIEQLGDVRFDYDNDERMFIVGKKRMASEFKIKKSPDDLESFMMAFYSPLSHHVNPRNQTLGNIIIRR